MGDLSTLRQAVADRLGYGENYSDDTRLVAKIDRSINWAQAYLCKKKFMFLRKLERIRVTANQIKYELASDFGVEDGFKILMSTDETGDVTTWTMDTVADKTGHFDSAVGSDVGANSIVQIDDNTYVIQSITGDGTAADSVELDYATSSTASETGTVHWISDTSATHKEDKIICEGSFNEIYFYPTTSNKSIPMRYHIESASSVGRKYIWIGYPTSDDSYLVEYWYFQRLSDLSSTTSESLISKVYSDTPLISGALYKVFKDMKDTQRSAESWIEFRQDISDMAKECPIRAIKGLRA